MKKINCYLNYSQKKKEYTDKGIFFKKRYILYQKKKRISRMDTRIGMLVMVGICILVLAIGFLRKYAEVVLNFFVRAILGIMAIYVINIMLVKVGITGAVGINPITVLTAGSLGTGGIALLYGILFYSML